MPSRTKALELFNAKWPGVQKLIAIHARNLGLRSGQLEDMLQHAALNLWHYCRAKAGTGKPLNCRVIALAAWQAFRREQRRDDRRLQQGRPLARLHQRERRGNSDEWTIDPPARAVEIRVDGITLNLTDAAIDEPELYDLAANGISGTETAHMLRKHTRSVYDQAKKLGGRQLPLIGWRFSRDTVQAPPSSR